jgi:hypothetical protein
MLNSVEGDCPLDWRSKAGGLLMRVAVLVVGHSVTSAFIVGIGNIKTI